MATKQIAQGLAGLGRYGDSTLVHMQPEEVAGLQALAKTQGTTLTINPETGLPEAFSLGGFFKSLLPTIAGFAAAGMSGGTINPLTAGIIAGAGTGALTNKKDPLMGAVMGGMGGYGGAGLYNVGAAMPGQAANFETAMGLDKAYTAGQGANAATAGFENAMGLSNAYNAGSPAMANIANAAGTTTSDIMLNPQAQQALQNQSTNAFQQGIGRVSGAAGNLADVATFQPGAYDAFTAAGGSMMKAALPIGSAVLGGLEPSDIYGNPIKPGQNPNEKYDPYRSLNLSGDTGLRLYAQGGPVSFADGGDSNKEPAGLPGGGLGSLRGGDAGATQGAGMLPLDVSDINAKYGVEDAGVPVPRLGLFANNDQIEAARTAYETQLKAAMSGRGGMGSPFSFGYFGKPNTGMNYMSRVTDALGQPTQVRGMGGMQNPNGGMNSMGMMTRTIGGTGIGATAPTASTAETALSRLNLNKTYADGGTIQSGGTQDLYGSQDDAMTGPMLSRNGYGLGRLQAMADGGMASYAKGGETRVNLNTQSGLEPITREQLQNRDVMMTASLGNPFAAYGVNPDNYDGYINKIAGLAGAVKDRIPFAKGGYLDGPGDGMSDSIPATIEGKQPARLADGEFVIPADVVSHLGNGSTKAGSQRLYGMLDKVRKARTGTKKQGKQIKPEKYMPA